MGFDPAAESGDFFTYLVNTHACIEERLKEMERATAKVNAAGPGDADIQAIAGVLDFFSGAGARHQDDEELTLFPRLRPHQAFAQILNALEVQHQMCNEAQRNLAGLVGQFSPGDGKRLDAFASRFAEMQRGHMIAEERALFPLAARTLSRTAIAEMTAEMRERPSR